MALIKGTLGKEKRHYHSQGDTLGRCPHCYNNNVEKIGVLSVEGVPRDVLKCRQCNTLHSGADGGIQSLVEEAKETFATENVGFVSAVVNDGVPLTSSGSQYSYQDLNEIVDSSNGIKNEVQQLRYDLQNLTNVIRDMATQNHDLMEKLMTDPLNGMREAVSDFNLE
jgi:hypothetical protein